MLLHTPHCACRRFGCTYVIKSHVGEQVGRSGSDKWRREHAMRNRADAAELEYTACAVPWHRSFSDSVGQKSPSVHYVHMRSVCLLEGYV